ncbi:MAG: SDR family NAD(P)-dependent oxidoreductase [Arenimonas sp.]|nr:SDR family NAD(P)-dependent oxidoreductase [Arenimonas sp.]
MISIPQLEPGSLKNKVILITGAYGGLGEASAIAVAEAGATVVLLGKKIPKLNRIYDAVNKVGIEPALYPLDMRGADPADYEAMADKIEEDLGGLHGILHCAADFSGLRPLETTEPEEFLTQLHVNLTAPWLLTQACLPALRKSADSAVVFVCEDLNRVNKAYWGAYGIAKAGLDGMIRMLHDETESSSVRVSGLQPGPMKTSIRVRAFVDEAATNCPAASHYAPACVYLLSAAGTTARGQILRPSLV